MDSRYWVLGTGEVVVAVAGISIQSPANRVGKITKLRGRYLETKGRGGERETERLGGRDLPGFSLPKVRRTLPQGLLRSFGGYPSGRRDACGRRTWQSL
ncbi:MAG: hypothetical protein GH151_01150 [Bacteroidetes bacterium]|nr:hypothetical protein [Bacteroidota bacterium]